MTYRPTGVGTLALAVLYCLGGAVGVSQAADPPGAEAPVKIGTVIEKVEPAVVFISTHDQLGKAVGLGTGFVIDADGLVMTNYHVINQAAVARVKFRDGAEMRVVGYRALDPKRDLALLQLEKPPKKLATLPLVRPDNVKSGDSVIAIGHPRGFGFTVTNGIVGAVRTTGEMPEDVQQFLKAEPETRWIQVTAPLGPGNSGGPLLGERGDVIGMNTFIVEQNNLGFALHAEHLVQFAGKKSDTARPLPVPGSLLAPTVNDRSVMDALAAYRRDADDFIARFKRLTTQREKQRLLNENPTLRHVAALQKIVEAQPKSRAAFESLVTICRLTKGGADKAQQTAFRQAVELLSDHHPKEPSMGAFAIELVRAPSDAVRRLQGRVLDAHPEPADRAFACVALAHTLAGDPVTRGRAEAEYQKLFLRAANEFKDVQFGNQVLGDMADQWLFNLLHSNIGHTARDISGKDSAGEAFRLDDYKNKVRLIDFWVNWCPYCREMYPEERFLLEKYKGKPFAILGVNGETPATLRAVEASKTVTWRSWSDGEGGPIAAQWGIESYPTIVLLDDRGVIRLKGNFKGRRLSDLIDRLMLERELALPRDPIAPCSVWNYLDTGVAPPADWTEVKFDDGMWHSGHGPFGYELEEDQYVVGEFGTLIAFGPSPQFKHPTTYFRRPFHVKDVASVKDLILGLLCKAGAAVYLNGREVARRAVLPAAHHSTLADRSGAKSELEWRYYSVDPALLVEGQNVLAAEAHLDSLTANELYFDATLSANGAAKLIHAARDPGNLAQRWALAGLVDVGEAASSAISDLEKFASSDDLELRLRATAALVHLAPARYGPTHPLPDPIAKDKLSQGKEIEGRKRLAAEFQEYAWALVVPARSPRSEYQKALRYSKAALVLEPSSRDARAAAAAAEFRLGNAEKAVAAFTETPDATDARPSRIAFLTMAQHKMGQVDRARQSYERLQGTMKLSPWRDNPAAKALYEQTASALGDTSSKSR
jgi:thiol-disulfide isomerase/thioredoxin